MVCDDLHEIRLGDELADVESQNRLGTRPGCFRSGLHEASFVVFVSCISASFMVLHHTTTILNYSVKEDLAMIPAEVAWTTASLGCVWVCCSISSSLLFFSSS